VIVTERCDDGKGGWTLRHRGYGEDSAGGQVYPSPRCEIMLVTLDMTPASSTGQAAE